MCVAVSHPYLHLPDSSRIGNRCIVSHLASILVAQPWYCQRACEMDGKVSRVLGMTLSMKERGREALVGCTGDTDDEK